MAQPSLGPEPVDDSLHISVARSDHGPTIHLAGVLDGATSGAFSDVVAATAGRPCRQVTVSLAGVTFLDCRGLTALLRAQRLLKDTGNRLTLSAVPAHCLRLSDLADLMTRAALVVAGYRQHKRGEWRKRREEVHTAG